MATMERWAAPSWERGRIDRHIDIFKEYLCLPMNSCLAVMLSGNSLYAWKSWWLCSIPLLDCGFRPESFWRASPYKTLKVRSLLWASLTGVLQVLEFVGKGGLVDLFLPKQRIMEPLTKLTLSVVPVKGQNSGPYLRIRVPKAGPGTCDVCMHVSFRVLVRSPCWVFASVIPS